MTKEEKKKQAADELIACLERLDSKLDKWLENTVKLLVEDHGKEETLRMFPNLKEYVEKLSNKEDFE